MVSLPLSADVVAYLANLTYRAEAKQGVCWIPLGGLYWKDELPEIPELMRLAEGDRYQILRLFSIRYRLWDGEPMSADDQQFWSESHSQVPNWAFFRRLSLTPAEMQAHRAARQASDDVFEELFADADKVTVTDCGHGIQSFSATFDLTKNEVKTAEKESWWKRYFRKKAPSVN
jgi:hypothetical protein